MKDISHDSVNRFLLRENYTPQDLFNEVKDELILEGGVVSVDDSVLDKPDSDPKKSQLIDYFWSGKHKKSVKGINLITLYYTDVAGVSYPINEFMIIIGKLRVFIGLSSRYATLNDFR